MRATQESNLPETAYIQAFVRTDDGQGGYSEAWQTVSQSPARIGEIKGETEKTVASGISVGKVAVITMPASVALNDTDRIQINGTQYIVHWTNKKKSHLTALRAMVTEV